MAVSGGSTPAAWRSRRARARSSAGSVFEIRSLERPDRFHLVAAADVNPVVEIHGRIAMRRDEFDVVAELRTLGCVFHIDIAEFVAAPAVRRSRNAGRLGP